MKLAMNASTPVLRTLEPLRANGWHLPYVTEAEHAEHQEAPHYLAKLSAARCARVSYLTHDGRVPNAAADLALYERLVGSRPMHASPIEHLAHAIPTAFDHSRNFLGWRQSAT